MKAGYGFRSMAVALVLGVAFLFGASTAAHAQPTLNFKRVINNWPVIELYFSVACAGQPAYNMGVQNFEVYENGIKIGDFTLWCPDPRAKCAISVALVFDCSGSMGGAPLSAAIQAGLNFVGNMDGVLDEACVVRFESFVSLIQTMTTSRTLLLSAISGLTPGGATAAWDGCYEGLLEVIRAGTNPCRAVIMLTDGENNTGTHDPTQIINLATRNRIRVFTIGLGSAGGAGELQTIANSTGGRYYNSPTPAQLFQIYEDISSILRQGFQECLITYEAKCMDGAKRVVDLVLKNFCGGSDQKSKTYTAPKDTSTYIDMNISLGKGMVKGGQEVKIPLNLDTPIDGENFYPATFTIQIDNPSCGVQFRKIETPVGSLLAGVPITVTPSGLTITFQTTQRKILYGSGMLAELTFLTGDPIDTCCSNITITSWKFEQGCFRPLLTPGVVCVIPLKPVVTCQISAPSDLIWDRYSKDYSPNPFTVNCVMTNSGDKDAKTARFKITYNKSDFSLAGPMTDVQLGKPKDVPKDGGTSEAKWDLRAKRRTQGKTVQVCITASFDNHPDVTCCADIYIPPTEPILECSITAPKIIADKALQKYDPMPFDVSVTVDNVGGSKTDEVWATIIVPPDLALSGPDAPNRNTKKVSSSIAANGQASTSWQLKHPITLTQIDYTVTVWVKTSNADSTMCEYKITIPPLDAPVLQPQCFTPDSLHFDEGLNSYIPNPFNVTLSCKNVGGLSANNVTAYIYLPANVILDDPLDSLRKTFNPSTLDPYKPGNAVPTLTWRVRYTKKLRFDTQLDFKWVVGGMTQLGVPIDSVESWCEVRVPGLAPAFDCVTILPDSCALNANETDVTPNPFTLTYKVWNTSKLPSTISTVTVQWPAGQGISLEPPTQPIVKIVNAPLAPAETLTVTWTFKIQNRITRRLIPFSVIAVDEDGSPVRTCSDILPIAALKTALVCEDLLTSEPAIIYRPVTQDYAPTSFVITEVLTNTGGAPLHNAWAKIEKDDPYDLIELDPGYADPGFGTNDTLRTLGYIDAAKSKSMTWGYRLKQPNRTDISQFVKFSMRFKSDETPEVFDICPVFVEVTPVVVPSLVCTLSAPDTIWFLGNYYNPSPYDLRLRVENVGTGDALNVKAFVLQNTRFSIIPPSMLAFDTLLAGESIEPFGNPGFKLTVNPRATDGFDTVRVTVAADGIPSFTCELPIFVMHEQRPKFTMVCQATPNTLAFDDQLNDYVPNPFNVTTNVQNIGDTKAIQCQMAFIGPPRFTPDKDSPIEAFGTLDTMKSFSFNWRIRALCRPTAGWDTLYFQVQGRGGLNDRLVTDTCRALVYIPACRAPEYGIGCEQLHKFIFDNNAGQYIPPSVLVSDTIRNAGLAEGIGLEATIALPPGLYLETGESATKPVPNLKSGESSVVTWIIRPIARRNDTTLTVKVSVKDRFGKSAECDLTKIFVPLATNFALTCETGTGVDFPDALTVDKQLGIYAGRPFNATITVTNSGQRPLDSVYVLILPDSRDILIGGQPLVLVALRLDPGASAPWVWQWNCLARTVSGPVQFRFVVSAKSSVSSECSKDVFIPEIGRPQLDAILSTTPKDTLHYDNGIGDYEGTRSSKGSYNVFTVTANVTNIGAAQANSVTATILPPSGVSLDEGEVAIKPVAPSDLIVNGQGVVSWKFRPIRQPDGVLRTFDVQVTSLNAKTVTSGVDLFIQGAPKLVTLTIPQDNVGRFGDKIVVPVLINETLGKDVFSYRMNVKYDPKVVRFDYVTSKGTQTEWGWSGPRATQYTDASLGDLAILRVEDFTTGTKLNSRVSGILVYLVFEGIYNTDQLKYSQSELTMTDFMPSGGTTPLLTSMNSLADNLAGDVVLSLEQGMVTVSGECITPLNSLLKYQLAQNTPNPFNPTTVIEYQLPEETEVTLYVFDQLGRQVREIAQGRQKAGKYSLTFDASGLASGTYTYRIETPRFTKSLRMILAR